MGAGRPVVDNQAILDQVKKDPKLLRALVSAVDDIESCLTIIEGAKEKVKRIVESTNESTKLSKGFITKIAKEKYNGTAEVTLGLAEALAEAVELLEKKEASDQAEDDSF